MRIGYFSLSRLRIFLPFILVPFSIAPSGAATQVVYPAYETSNDVRYNDLIEILHAALEKTAPEFGPYRIQASRQRMNEARYLLELKSNDAAINIAWSSTSVEKEHE